MYTNLIQASCISSKVTTIFTNLAAIFFLVGVLLTELLEHGNETGNSSCMVLFSPTSLNV